MCTTATEKKMYTQFQFADVDQPANMKIQYGRGSGKTNTKRSNEEEKQLNPIKLSWILNNSAQ